MKKLIFSLFLVIIAITKLFATTFEKDGIAYSILTENTVEVISKSPKYSGSVVIPETVIYNSTTYSVTMIGSYAFNNCSDSISVTIPNSVTTIGADAFYNCSGLTSITIPSSVTTIGEWAFENCTKITSVIWNAKNCNGYNFGSQVETFIFGEKVETIPNSLCKRMDKLTSISIPNSVTTIGDEAFQDCTSLTSVTIPNSVTTIGGYAFFRCSGLTFISIPNSVTSIGERAFSGRRLTSIDVDTANTHYYSMDGVLFNYAKDTLIQYPIGNTRTEYTIPNSVTTIGDWAFEANSGLTSISIPNSVTTIGDEAFTNCDGLTSITIPNSVTTIGKCAFQDCEGLTSVTIGNSVRTIPSEAFYYCIGLTSITIGNSVTTIGNYAFGSCSVLTSITIPGSVTTIGNYAFFLCKGLTSVTCEATTPPICGSSCFSSVSKDIPVYVPVDAIDAYKTTDKWKDFTNIQAMPTPNNVITYTATEKLTSFRLDIGSTIFGSTITSHTFSNGTGTITCNGDITMIGESAFSYCDSLTSITIPNSVTTIGDQAFHVCSSLTSITIPNSVTTIGKDAFFYCINLTSIAVETGNTQYDSRDNCNAIIETATNTLIVGCNNTTIPSSVTTIGRDAFFYCSGLTSVTIPNSVTTIGDQAFYGCSGLTSITIPSSVTTIGDQAFNSCSGLTSINVEIGNPKYDSRDNCNALIETETNTLIAGCMNTVIPNSITKIGYRVFFRCSGLTSVTIPTSVTTVEYGAFESCSSLTSVTVRWTDVNELPVIGSDAFSGIADGGGPSAATLHVPAGTKSIYEAADQWKDFGTIVSDTPTPLPNALMHNSQPTMHKYFHNGNLIIERNGVKYTPAGQKIR